VEDAGIPQGVDCGSYPHQIRITPSNKHVVVVARGTRPTSTSPGTPGALKVSSFKDGKLTNHASIAPNGGQAFGPRHLDFHPTRPWVYVSLELQNKLHMYSLQNDQFSQEPLHVRDTLPAGTFVVPRQVAGTIHVHPNGRTVYVANRCNGTVEFEGKPFYTGGDNSIAVYAIDQQTGEPTLIQNEDTRGMHARTFSIDPTGRLMVAQHNIAVHVRDADSTGSHVVPGGFSLLRVGADGKLAFLKRYPVETGHQKVLWWSKLYRVGN
jgi:6-phosphogluconolactonase